MDQRLLIAESPWRLCNQLHAASNLIPTRTGHPNLTPLFTIRNRSPEKEHRLPKSNLKSRYAGGLQWRSAPQVIVKNRVIRIGEYCGNA
jgi:hypothetical protein